MKTSKAARDGPAASSLERLKNLDARPDFASQLAEARELCNHAHRAEMIARWLLTNLQSRLEARVNAESWRLITQCIRLLGPPRIATTIGRFDVIDIVMKCLEEAEHTSLEAIVISICELFSVCAEISEGSNGAAVKSLFTVPSNQASLFFESWTRAVLRLLDSSNLSNPRLISDRLLEPPLSIWRDRKASSSDHSDFVKQCFYPAVCLLQHTNDLQGSASSPKRRISSLKEGAQYKIDCNSELRRLLVKHVFSPCRAMVLKGQSTPTNNDKATSQVGEDIFNAMSELRRQSEDTLGRTGILFPSLPILLEIALGFTPTTTQRQRLQEQPWVQAIFDAQVIQCLVIDGVVQDHQIIVSMLEVVRHRASLPKIALQDLLLKYSGLSAKLEDDVQWHLVAKVAEIDGSVFIDDNLAEVLFKSLTVASPSPTIISDFTPAQDATNLLDRPEGLHILLRESVVLPVMRAYAHDRKLPTFFQFWKMCMQDGAPQKVLSIFDELSQSLAELLEVSLTEEQIENEITLRMGSLGRSTALIRVGQSDELESNVLSDTQGDLVLANAILRAIRSDSLQDRLYPKVHHWLLALLAALESQLKDQEDLIFPVQVWPLLTCLFELWWPRWASQQTDTSLVNGKARSFLESPVMQNALKNARFAREDNNVAQPRLKTIEHADTFVACICNSVYGLPDCSNEVKQCVEQLLSRPPPVSVALLGYPSLLSSANNELYQGTTTKLLKQHASHSTEDETGSLTTSLTATLCAASGSHLQGDALDSLLELIGESDARGPSVDEHIAINVLLKMNLSALNRPQRESLLDRLAKYPSKVREPAAEVFLQKRFAVMVQLLTEPSATATVSTDASVLLELRPISGKKHKKDGLVCELATFELYAEVVHLTVRQLVDNASQDRSRIMLESLVSNAMETCTKKVDDGTWTSDLGVIIFVRIMLDILNELPDAAQNELEKQYKKQISRLRKKLTGVLQSLVEEFGQSKALDATSIRIAILLEAVSSFSKGDFEDEVNTALLSMMRSIADQDAGDDQESIQASSYHSKAVAVRAHNLYCTQRSHSPTVLVDITRDLLRSKLEPKQSNTIRDNFRQACAKQEHSGRRAIIRTLLDSRNTSTEDLKLLNEALEVTSKDDIAYVDDDTEPKPLVSLLDLLVQQPPFPIATTAVDCVLQILTAKPFLVNQYGVEKTISTLCLLAKDDGKRAGAPASFLQYCALATGLLKHHRARLQGRYHLVIQLLQSLLHALFARDKPSATSKTAASSRQARAYARLVTLFCNPPQPHRQHQRNRLGGTTDNPSEPLIDEARRSRALVGQFAHYVLHSYCSLVLVRGTLGAGMREALMPGLWALIEAVEVRSPEGIKALSGAMTNSERAVLRGVYEDWKRFGKWEGV